MTETRHDTITVAAIAAPANLSLFRMPAIAAGAEAGSLREAESVVRRRWGWVAAGGVAGPGVALKDAR